ncbi:MAG TPA: hypothetical protein PKG63_03715 [Bacteroidales bacterium]|nr:hypothetical protein [Bacteroidales bacterium]
MNQKNAYVFVVCGERKHIETLHFSLKSLKLVSQFPIWVVTDKKRNEIEIEHDNIIDVSTPEDFNHHQASIWLKTSLHRILPKGTTYCYLDSDVIAMNEQCNHIFEHYVAPISFAHDHTLLSYFSPYALNCGCIEAFQKDYETFQNQLSKVIQHPNYPPDYNNVGIRKLFAFQKSLLYSTSRLLLFLFKLIKAFFRGKASFINDIVLDIRNKNWIICSTLEYPVLLLHYSKIKTNTDYRFDFIKLRWKKKNGKCLAQNRCNHLREALKNVFNVDVYSDWHHWNGGVFIFDDRSYNFMEQWHQNTLLIFQNRYWKVRDQGTLIATVFQNNLQQHPTLPEKYNFIADFYKTEIKAAEQKNVFFKGKEKICPSFIHIYHHWGDLQWDVWQHVVKTIEKNNINDHNF